MNLLKIFQRLLDAVVGPMPEEPADPEPSAARPRRARHDHPLDDYVEHGYDGQAGNFFAPLALRTNLAQHVDADSLVRLNRMACMTDDLNRPLYPGLWEQGRLYEPGFDQGRLRELGFDSEQIQQIRNSVPHDTRPPYPWQEPRHD